MGGGQLPPRLVRRSGGGSPCKRAPSDGATSALGHRTPPQPNTHANAGRPSPRTHVELFPRESGQARGSGPGNGVTGESACSLIGHRTSRFISRLLSAHRLDGTEELQEVLRSFFLSFGNRGDRRRRSREGGREQPGATSGGTGKRGAAPRWSSAATRTPLKFTHARAEDETTAARTF